MKSECPVWVKLAVMVEQDQQERPMIGTTELRGALAEAIDELAWQSDERELSALFALLQFIAVYDEGEAA